MELQALVLALLEPRPLYGYEIVQRAKSKGKLQWEEGTLYPLLHKMEREGLLRSEWRSGPHGKDRKYYAITRQGKTVLTRARSDWKEWARAVTAILKGGGDG